MKQKQKGWKELNKKCGDPVHQAIYLTIGAILIGIIIYLWIGPR